MKILTFFKNSRKCLFLDFELFFVLIRPNLRYCVKKVQRQIASLKKRECRAKKKIKKRNELVVQECEVSFSLRLFLLAFIFINYIHVSSRAVRCTLSHTTRAHPRRPQKNVHFFALAYLLMCAKLAYVQYLLTTTATPTTTKRPRGHSLAFNMAAVACRYEKNSYFLNINLGAI